MDARKNQRKKYTHLFFDVDGTLTPSRSTITKDVEVGLLSLLESGHSVTVVCGPELSQVKRQIPNDALLRRTYILSQSGNHALGPDFKVLWINTLSSQDKADILDHIEEIRTNLPTFFVDVNEHDLVEDRGCQISFSFIGHHAPLPSKAAFDPDSSRRAEILRRFPVRSNRVEARIGGTTCFDYTAKGKHKGLNVKRLITDMKWKDAECIYVGDALFEGGNDSSVIGVIDTHQVSGPVDTAAFIKSQLA